jgi:hypothetical protein
LNGKTATLTRGACVVLTVAAFEACAPEVLSRQGTTALATIPASLLVASSVHRSSSVYESGKVDLQPVATGSSKLRWSTAVMA